MRDRQRHPYRPSVRRRFRAEPRAIPLISLIVPIYDVEDYLTECLDSVAAQSLFARLEVILVDDGSTDTSGQIAPEFASRHANVRLVSQRNAGLGAARNTGMRQATGEFLAFLDSDDRCPGTLCCTCSAGSTTPSTWPWVACAPSPPRRAGPGSTSSRRCGPSTPSARPRRSSTRPACGAAFRSSFVRDLGLRFAEDVHFEDVYFTVPALLRARRIVLVDKLVYEYRKRDAGGSIMDSLFTREKNYWDHLLAVEFLADLRRGLTDAEDEALCRFMVRSFQGFAMRAPEVLGEPEQTWTFFDRCVDVYASVPVDVVRTTALDLRHRIAFARRPGG